MIHKVEGDILLTKAEVTAHGVAPNDHFMQGLALSLREQWPGMYKDFRHYAHQQHPKPGGIWSWAGPGKRIVALLTQEGEVHHGHDDRPGRAKVSNVNHALKDLAKFLNKQKVTSVALPKIATGVGGLDWDDVEPLISKHLGDVDGLDVYVYETFHPGQAAEEPGLA